MNKGAILFPGDYLRVGDYLQNAAKKHFAVLQKDGNFVVYSGTPTAKGGPGWHTVTYGQVDFQGYVLLTPDGNLILAKSAPSPALPDLAWNSQTDQCWTQLGLPSDCRIGLWLRNDGTLVLFYASLALPTQVFPFWQSTAQPGNRDFNLTLAPITLDMPTEFWTDLMGETELSLPPQGRPLASPGVQYGPDENQALCGSSQALGLHDSSFTVEAWIYIDQFPAYDLPILVGDAAVAPYIHLVVRYKKLYMGFFANDTGGKTELSAGRWYHVAFRYNKADSKQAIFIDGNLDIEEGNHAAYTAGKDVVIGRYLDYQFHGRIADLRIWNHPRSQAEIALGRQRRLSGAEPGLMAHYPSGFPDRSALEFDGATAYVSLPTTGLLLERGLTLEAWVRFDTLTVGTRIFELGQRGACNLYLAVTSATTLEILFRASQTSAEDKISVSLSQPLATDRWTHLAVSLDAAGRAVVHVNGTGYAAERKLVAPSRAVGLGLLLGKGNGAADPLFKGQMAEVRLWNGARATSQIQTCMRRALRGDEDGLCGYWKLDGGSSQTAVNELGLGQPDSLVGLLSPSPFPVPLGPPLQTMTVARLPGEIQIADDASSFESGLTVEAWICPNSLPDYRGIFTLGYYVRKDHILLMASGTGQVALEIGKAGAKPCVVTDPGCLKMHIWQHVAATVDQQGVARIYIDGRLVKLAAINALPETLLRQENRIGHGIGSFDGRIAQLRLWNRCRSADELRADMSRTQIEDPNLLGVFTAEPRFQQSPALVGTWLEGADTVVDSVPIAADGWPGLCSVTHEGKPILFRTELSGQVSYSVRMSGFEDNALKGSVGVAPGWEPWKALPLQSQDNDESVLQRERQQLTYTEDGQERYVMRSRYLGTASGRCQVQAVSTGDQLYVFRQSRAGTLLVNRFVLDGLTNTLNPKLEVRYQRSQQRYQPRRFDNSDARPSAIGFGLAHDSLGFRDVAGNPFIEPTTELCEIREVQDGLFAVLCLPSDEPEVLRWHIFLWDQKVSRLCIYTLRTTPEGTFDVRDSRSLLDQSPIAGITRTDIVVKHLASVTSLAATRYDVQRQEVDASGAKRFVRDSVRVMLVASGAAGTVSLSFAVARDGTLSQLPPATDVDPNQKVIDLCRTSEEIMLPADTLDGIITYTKEPAPSGDVLSLSRAQDSTQVRLSGASSLKAGDSVVLSADSDLSGLYTAKWRSTDEFEVTLPGKSKIGAWTKYIDPESALVMEGQIQQIAMSSPGTLLVRAPNHGLQDGEKILLQGVKASLGQATVTSAIPTSDGTPPDQFVVQRSLPRMAASSLRRIFIEKLRGLTLEPTGSR